MRFDAGSVTQASWTPPTRMRARASARRGRLPVAAVRPDYELIPLNGFRLITPGQRPAPAGAICAVSYRAELRPSAWEVLSHLFDPQAAVVSRHRLTGGRPVDEFEAAGSDDSAWSLDSAIAAAASLLGRPVTETGSGAVLEAVREDTASLVSGDIITRVDGKPIATAVQLRAALAGLNAAELSVLRAPGPGSSGGVAQVRIARHADGSWGIRVVTAGRQLCHDLQASFTLPDDLRGPSLGLACALSVIDAVTGGNLAAGGMVVATGTVDLAGRIGGVGAVEYKARAVRAHSQVRRFLVPADPSDDVDEARRVLTGHAEVIAVSSLAEAVEVLYGPNLLNSKGTHRSPDRRWVGTAR
ncbi:MAG: S16 family serine protease [Jatrophihabitantaceae bacterium]